MVRVRSRKDSEAVAARQWEPVTSDRVAAARQIPQPLQDLLAALPRSTAPMDAVRTALEAELAASPLLREVMAGLAPYAGHAQVVGITGSPGVGKSTSTNALVAAMRRAGRRVGVLAIDPSSPFSGGALLGDRVRMGDHATDDAGQVREGVTFLDYEAYAEMARRVMPLFPTSLLLRLKISALAAVVKEFSVEYTSRVKKSLVWRSDQYRSPV